MSASVEGPLATGEKAGELMRQLERLALSDPGDDHPYKVTIVATRTVGDVFTVVYRHAFSPQLLGRRGTVSGFAAGFEPRQTMLELAGILLRDMSEPSGEGRGGPGDWALGLVPDPSAVGWIGVGS